MDAKDAIPHQEPAASAIKKIGGGKPAEGVKVMARITGKDVAQVRKWRLPRDRDGTGGIIPHWHHEAILESDEAKAAGVTIEDLTIAPQHRRQPEGVAAGE